MNERSKKIMVADDDPGIVDAICIMLEFEGYEVSSTVNGATVMDMRTGYPDLLVLDIWMSGQDGREICRQLKKGTKTHNIPVLMISASKDIRQSALDAGADDFLAKPFEMNDLLHKVDELLHLRQN
jgi:DNA-binding response OmpR family regulator